VLGRAVLRGAVLGGAVLGGAVLGGAVLGGAVLGRAVLRGAARTSDAAAMTSIAGDDPGAAAARSFQDFSPRAARYSWRSSLFMSGGNGTVSPPQFAVDPN
jgi:Pentapeptide repeats (8 copies)